MLSPLTILRALYIVGKKTKQNKTKNKTKQNTKQQQPIIFAL